MTVTEEDAKANLLNGGYDGNTVSLQTWEEAARDSQAWADKARRKSYYKHMRHRAYWIFFYLGVILALAIYIVVHTGS